MSTLNVSNITDGTDTVETGYVLNGSAKAWMAYNGSTNVLRSNLNTSSVTDNATGDFTQTFTSAFTSGDDTAVVTGKTNQVSNAGNAFGANVASAGTHIGMVVYENGSKVDAGNIFTLVVGDLA